MVVYNGKVFYKLVAKATKSPKSFKEFCLPLSDVFYQILSSLNGDFYQRCVLTKVVFHKLSSSFKAHLPSKMSTIKGHNQLMVFFHLKKPSIKVHLHQKLVFHQSSPSIDGHLPLKNGFHQKQSSMLYMSFMQFCIILKAVFP